MDESQHPSSLPGRLVGGSSLRLVIYLGALVIGIWLLMHVVLQLRLTEVLSRAIAVTGAEWIMYLLIGLSVLSVGVTIERWLFYRHRAVDAEPYRRRLQELLRNERTDEAIALAESLPEMEGRSVTACLRSLDQGADAMERELATTLTQEKLHYERNLIILGTLGNNAPFIGLFGTVLGIIKAFMDLAQDIAGGAAVVMAGISEALVANAEYLAQATIAFAEATPQSASSTEEHHGN